MEIAVRIRINGVELLLILVQGDVIHKHRMAVIVIQVV
jgi:hypothetical protein